MNKGYLKIQFSNTVIFAKVQNIQYYLQFLQIQLLSFNKNLPFPKKMKVFRFFKPSCKCHVFLKVD